MPLEMEPYPTFHKFFKIYTSDARMIEHFKDYFYFITDKKDVQRIMGTFEDVISSLRKEMDEKHSGKGFFLIIVLRLFSYFITRENMKALIKGEDF
jgi:hypothetical protein